MRPGLLIVLTVLSALPALAPAQVMLAADPYNDQFRVMDLLGNPLATTNLYLDIPGSVFDGCNGVARNPVTGQIFLCFEASGAGLVGRGLGILGPIGATTEVTLVGDLGDRVSALTFDDSGTLYGVTGDGATTPEHLFTIDVTTAAMTPLTALGSGDDGEALAFNPDDGLLYHASGGTFGGPAVFESIDPASGAVTAIGYTSSALIDHEIFGMVHDPATGEFIAFDLDQQLISISTAGVKTSIADLTGHGFSFFVRGFALVAGDALSGTADDLVTSFSINFGASRVIAWGGETVSMNTGDTLFVAHDSPQGSLHYIGPFVVFGSLVATANVDQLAEPFPGLHLDFNGLFVIFLGSAGGLTLGLPPGGYQFGFNYPGGLGGSSIIIQAAVSTANVANGIFASTHGLRVDFH